MGLILLEALGALALLVLVVWWTMFAGRRGGERQDHASIAPPDAPSPPAEGDQSGREGGSPPA